MANHKKRARLAKQATNKTKNSSTPQSRNRNSSTHKPSPATASKSHVHHSQHKKNQNPQSQHKPLQPFNSNSDVLLVGEGDLSFARALLEVGGGRAGGMHGTSDAISGALKGFEREGVGGSKSNRLKVRTLTATSLDSREEVVRKYPGVKGWLEGLEGGGVAEQGEEKEFEGFGDGDEDEEHVGEDEDDAKEENGNEEEAKAATQAIPNGDGPDDHDGEGLHTIKGDDDDDDDDHNDHENIDNASTPPHPPLPSIRIHHNINATRLHTYKSLRRLPPYPSSPFPPTSYAHHAFPHRPPQKDRKGYTHIIFNFPHVGGLSTDQSRQKLANQKLLLGFFNSAKGLLRPQSSLPTTGNPPRHDHDHNHDYHDTSSDDNSPSPPDNSDDQDNNEPDESHNQSGRVVITLFTGAPYESWNIRTLAKSAGYECERSGVFDWGFWGGRGYGHVRTLGGLVPRANKRGNGQAPARDGEGAEPDGHGELGDEVQESDNGDGHGSGKSDNGDDRKDRARYKIDTTSTTQKRKKKAGWKGSQREARMYIFRLKEEEIKPEESQGTGSNDVTLGKGRGRGKRKKGGSDGSDDSD